MGFSGTILAAKAARGVDVDRVLAAFDFGPPEAGTNGWFISQGHRHFEGAADYVDLLVTALQGPTFIVKVFDGDWAYLVAATPSSEPLVVVLTPKATRTELRGRQRIEPKARRRKRGRHALVHTPRPRAPIPVGQR